jgi:hypothetical protein
VLRAFQGVLRAFQGVLRAFQGVIRAFQGVIRAFQGMLRAFQGHFLITAVGVAIFFDMIFCLCLSLIKTNKLPILERFNSVDAKFIRMVFKVLMLVLAFC